jgi:hypothetical protein
MSIVTKWSVCIQKSRNGLLLAWNYDLNLAVKIPVSAETISYPT